MKKTEIETFLDDNVVIPEYIKNMTREELAKEIARLEQEIRDKKINAQKKDVAV